MYNLVQKISTYLISCVTKKLVKHSVYEQFLKLDMLLNSEYVGREAQHFVEGRSV